ncbi:MAG: hypothetical protein DRP68_02685 [Candidatus Omnitrophota bacterium]|nr:MAG: hypothetical protein DRP68_02685 [Candidatus Omnitrophota bacterium]
MIRRTGVLVICIIFVGMISVSAQTLPKHIWELGTEISHIKYEEPGVMEEEGMMYGIAGSYTYRNSIMLKVEGRFAYGQVDYKNSGTLDNIDDYILEFRGLGGHDFSIFTASTLTPYIGIGYRYLNDDMSGRITSTGALGYERESNYIYSPIGVEIITPLKNGWSVGAMLEYDIFWWGKQISHLTDVPGYLEDAENRQKRGYGVRGCIKFQKKGEKLDFVIEPFIRYWNIKKSEETQVSHILGTVTVYEPKNNSTEYGIRFTLKF